MANISWLERRTGYSLLLLVVIGFSILPFASCQYYNTVIGEFISIMALRGLTNTWELLKIVTFS